MNKTSTVLLLLYILSTPKDKEYASAFAFQTAQRLYACTGDFQTFPSVDTALSRLVTANLINTFTKCHEYIKNLLTAFN